MSPATDSPERGSLAIGRRGFLAHSGGGFGALALAHLLGTDGALGADDSAGTASRAHPKWNGGLHHPARATRVVQLFMSGAASQCDTFDFKPILARQNGRKFDPGGKVELFQSEPGAIMASPWKWRQFGQSGKWVSDLLPHLARCVDDIAFLPAMVAKSNVHGPATFMQNTGFVLPGFPSVGAWVSYGLGNLSQNLPSFVVLPDSRGFAPNGPANWSAGFLPAANQGTMVRPGAKSPIFDLFPPDDRAHSANAQTDGLALLERLNRAHEATRPGDSRLEARIASYEMAARLQLSAPEVLDLSRESPVTRSLYGLDNPATEDFGRNCLIARRLLERGCASSRFGAAPTTDFPAATGIRTKTSPATTATWEPAWTGPPPL